MSGSASATSSAAPYVHPPTKTASRRKSRCSISVREVVAPFDRRPQRPLARIGIATALQQVEALRDSLEQLLTRETAVRGGELDREG